MDNALIRTVFGSQKKLAKKLKIQQQSVSDWVTGKKSPSSKNAKKIVALSGGAITFNDIFGDAA